MPTSATTFAPSSGPSFVIPELLELPAVADTYLRSGLFAGNVLGTDPEILIQSLPNDESGRGQALLSFDLTSIQRYLDAGATIPSVLLRLQNVATNIFPAPSTSQITISKLLGMEEADIESMTFGNFTRPSVVVDGPEFDVAASDSELDVDITSLVVTTGATPAGNSSRVRRGRRNMQQQVVDSRLVLLLQATNGSVASFRSREYEGGTFSPGLVLAFATSPPSGPGGSPSLPTNSVPGTTSPPTKTPAPTITPRPSVSSKPSSSPTTSHAPSLSSQPSYSPSISHSPTSSHAPSFGPTTPGGGNSTAPPGGNSTAPPGSNSTTPPGGNSTMPPGGNTTAPPTIDGTRPPTATSPPTNSPTITAKPTVSAMPSNGPTTSHAPSASHQPTSSPTKTGKPTTSAPTSSQNPTGCYESAQPRLTRLFGTANPLDARDVITTLAQKGTTVKFTITQLWGNITTGNGTVSNNNIVWIAPYWANLDGTETFTCDRTFDVAPLAKLTYTAPCYDDSKARVAVIVNDESFPQGTNFLLPEGCVPDARDLDGRKSVYYIEIPCVSTCDFSAAPSSTPA
jgi:hypothetical protein